MDEQVLLKTVSPAGLKNVIRALEGLEDKRLTSSMLWSKRNGCGCLLGAIYPESREMLSLSLVQAEWRSVETSGWLWASECREALVLWGEKMSLTPSEASSLQAFNDSVHLSMGDRYTYVLNALKKAVGDESGH